MAEYKILISAKDTATNEIEKLKGTVSRLNGELDRVKKTSKSFATLTTAVASGQAVFAAAQRAWGMVSGYVRNSVQAYGEQIQAEAQLQQALGGTSQALLDQANALQQSTTFADEQIVRAQSLVAMFVKEESQIKKLTPVILDFAAAKGMDLSSAADLVTKTLASETNALRRYGIDVKGAAGSVERMETLTRGLESAFKGQAQALANTDFGKLQQQKNLLNDVQESLGKEIVPLQVEWNNLMLVLAENIVPSVAAALDRVVTTRKEAQDEAMKGINLQLEREKIELETQIKIAEILKRKNVLLKEGGERRIVPLATAKAELDALTGQMGANNPALIASGKSTGGAGSDDAIKKEQARLDEWVKQQDEASQQKLKWEADFQRDREALQAENDARQAEADEAQWAAKIENRKTREEEETRIAQEEAQKRMEIAERERGAILGAAQSLSMSMNEIISIQLAKNAQTVAERKKAARQSATISYFTSLGAAAASIWTTPGGSWQEKLVESIALDAALSGQFAAQLVAIQSAATGADFVTRGKQLLLVGDNPSGREHVQVTPLGRGGDNGGSRFSSDVSGGIHISVSGNADANTVRELERRIPAAIASAARSGALRNAMYDMQRYNQ